MNSKTVKLVAVPILGIVFVYVLYQQYGTSTEQAVELAVPTPQKSVPADKTSDPKNKNEIAKSLSVKQLGSFNPFSRSRQIESLYQQPSISPSTAIAATESEGSKLVSKSETYLRLPSESLEATFESSDGWVAMINSKTYSVGDSIVNENGEQFGVIVQISTGNVVISQDQATVQ